MYRDSGLSVLSSALTSPQGGTLVLTYGSVVNFTGHAAVNPTNAQGIQGVDAFADVSTTRCLDDAFNAMGGQEFIRHRMLLPLDRTRKRVPSLGAEFTPAKGLLKMGWVIHLNGPDYGLYRSGAKATMKEYQAMRRALSSVFDEVDRLGATSVALPIVSGGAKRGSLALKELVELTVITLLQIIPRGVRVYYSAYTPEERNALYGLASMYHVRL